MQENGPNLGWANRGGKIWDLQEWVIKLGLFLLLAGILSFIAFKPADPAAYAEEPWSFTHNLFICTFDDPAERQSLIDSFNS